MNNLVGYGDDSDSDVEAPPPAAAVEAPSKPADALVSTPSSAPPNPAAQVPAQTPKPSTPTSTLTSPRRTLPPVSGSSLGIKRAASPLLSNRASPSASLHRSAVASSSRLRRAASPSAEEEDASTPREGIDSPYSIRYNTTGPTTPLPGSQEEVSEEQRQDALLRLLAPPPRINDDGSEDAEWGLPSQERAGEVDAALEAKLQKFHALKAEGTHFNTSLLRNRQLRNPRIYEQLVRWVDVDECACCFPERAPGVWSASAEQRRWMLREGGAERLADLQKSQQAEREAQQASGKSRAIDFTSSSAAAPAERPTNGASAATSSSASNANGKDAAALAMARAAAVRDKLMKADKERSGGHDRDRERERDKGRDRERERDGERNRGDRYKEKERKRERDGNAGWR